MRLAQEEINSLIEQHNKTRSGKDRDKIKCVIYWGKGWSWVEIAEALFLTENTIRANVEKYQSHGTPSLKGSRHKGNNFKLTPEQEKSVVEYVKNNHVLSSAQVCFFVLSQFNIEFTENGMTQTLKRLGCSYRKPKKIPAKADREEQEEWMKSFYDFMEKKSEEHEVYWIDGAGFQHNSNVTYGWFVKGDNAVIKTSPGRKRVNLNGALNCVSDEVIAIAQEETITVKTNVELLKKIIRKNRNTNEFTLILDNAKVNHGNYFTGFVEKINRGGKIKVNLLFLPTYSPNLNIIERLWGFVKKKVLGNRYFETFPQFQRAVIRFFTEGHRLYKDDFAGLFEWNFKLFA